MVHALLPAPHFLRNALAADLNGDGSEEYIVLAKEGDLVLVNQIPTTSGILSNDGGELEYLYRCPTEWITTDPVVFDFDGNGVLDLVFHSASGGNSFSASSDVAVWWNGQSFSSLNIGNFYDYYDFDSDGSLEIESSFDMPGLTSRGLDCDVSMATLRVIQYAPSRIWGWREGRLVDVSQDVPGFFREVKIPFLKGVMDEFREQQSECEAEECMETGDCLLDCMQSVLDRAEGLAVGGPPPGA